MCVYCTHVHTAQCCIIHKHLQDTFLTFSFTASTPPCHGPASLPCPPPPFFCCETNDRVYMPPLHSSLSSFGSPATPAPPPPPHVGSGHGQPLDLRAGPTDHRSQQRAPLQRSRAAVLRAPAALTRPQRAAGAGVAPKVGVKSWPFSIEQQFVVWDPWMERKSRASPL